MAPRQSIQDREDADGAARVPQPADHEPGLEPGRQVAIRVIVPQLGQGALTGVDPFHPPEHACVGVGQGEPDLGAPARVGLERQRLLQQLATRGAADEDLRAGGLPHHRDPIRSGRRLGQRPAQQLGPALGSATLDGGLGRLAQSRQDPGVACGTGAEQVGRHYAGPCSLLVQEARGRPVVGVALVVAERCLHCLADDRVEEARRVVVR